MEWCLVSILSDKCAAVYHSLTNAEVNEQGRNRIAMLIPQMNRIPDIA
jgi:hypothetical protein